MTTLKDELQDVLADHQIEKSDEIHQIENMIQHFMTLITTAEEVDSGTQYKLYDRILARMATEYTTQEDASLVYLYYAILQELLTAKQEAADER